MAEWMAFKTPLECIRQMLLGIFFSIVNDLLDDNVCLVLLQSCDDASTMKLFSFLQGSKVFILAKKYTCINNIPMHTKSKKVIY
jgi:hypothetical protein